MARGPRGGNKSNASGEGNGRSKRSAPYDGARGNRKGGDRNAAGGKDKDGGRGGRRNDSGGKGKDKDGKDGGRGRGRNGGRGSGGEKPKPRTAEDLDREMDSYWGKSEEHAAKKLDTDMDDYWKTKGAEADAVDEKPAEDETAAAPVADEDAAKPDAVDAEDESKEE